MNNIGPHGHPDPQQQALWDIFRQRGRDPQEVPVVLSAIVADDETLDAIIDGSDMTPAERNRILRELAGKPIHGCVEADSVDVTLRAMLGGYRNTITSRSLPPFNIDSGRVAELYRRRRNRQRLYHRIAWSIVVLVLAATAILAAAILASATAAPGDWLWPVHQFVYTVTS